MLEDWLEMQSRRVAMFSINADTHNVVVWVTSQFSAPLNNWWLNRKQHVAITDSSDFLVAETHETSLLPNIRDGRIDAMLGLTQGSMSYARYTQHFNDSSRRSRQHLTDDLHCVRLINELASFQFQTQAKSHRSQ
jgi:hypothetical protein